MSQGTLGSAGVNMSHLWGRYGRVGSTGADHQHGGGAAESEKKGEQEITCIDIIQPEKRIMFDTPKPPNDCIVTPQQQANAISLAYEDARELTLGN